MNYTKEELSKLKHERLYRLFQHVRAKYHNLTCLHTDWDCGNVGCHICLERSLERHQAELNELDDGYVEQVERYLFLIHAELKNRPYVEFTKKAKSNRKNQVLADLRGNRWQRNDKKHRKAI